MTRDEYLDKVRYGLKRIEKAVFQTKLLDLAHEILLYDECSKENFDRVLLLVECYIGVCLCELDEINGSLLYVEEYLKLPENKEIG